MLVVEFVQLSEWGQDVTIWRAAVLVQLSSGGYKKWHLFVTNNCKFIARRKDTLEWLSTYPVSTRLILISFCFENIYLLPSPWKIVSAYFSFPRYNFNFTKENLFVHGNILYISTRNTNIHMHIFSSHRSRTTYKCTYTTYQLLMKLRISPVTNQTKQTDRENYSYSSSTLIQQYHDETENNLLSGTHFSHYLFNNHRFRLSRYTSIMFESRYKNTFFQFLQK